MKESKVSIIVPCYKQAHFLDETLESVLMQTYSNWECIIVNDGSPDHTEDVAHTWLKRDSRFSYIKKENGGLPSARNAGIKASTGEYILPLDSDDLIDKLYLELVLREFKDDKLGIVSCASKHFKESSKQIIKISKPKGNSLKDILFENKLIATSLFRKKCWVSVDGYDESMKYGFEDWEFWISILKKGWEFKIIEEPLFFYRKKDNSMLIETNRLYKEKIMKYIFIKHQDVYKNNFKLLIEALLEDLKEQRVKNQEIKASLEYRLGRKLITKLKKLGLFQNYK
ncbi:glycosyltransferase family A protein [Winogradskyella damuponensis]|uniref:Glycosyltransferase family A protein n=1 Tax=Winogradskyella damuponensis TaxID=943939 RepID=A0ABP8CYQ8_9FLAO